MSELAKHFRFALKLSLHLLVIHRLDDHARDACVGIATKKIGGVDLPTCAVAEVGEEADGRGRKLLESTLFW